MAEKSSSKISPKWMVLYLLLAFVGWQMYKPKPKPPPRLTLEERGYRQVLIAGPPFDECVCIISVEFPGVFFWSKGNDYDLGTEVKEGNSSARTTSKRLKLWIHEDDLVKIGGLKNGMANGIKFTFGFHWLAVI